VKVTDWADAVTASSRNAATRGAAKRGNMVTPDRDAIG
jgi:hypothetical protein